MAEGCVGWLTNNIGLCANWVPFGTALLPGADAIQVLVRTQQELTVADRERSVGSAAVVLEDVVAQQFILRLGRHDVGALSLRDIIELAVGQHGRGINDARQGSSRFWYTILPVAASWQFTMPPWSLAQ